MYGDRQEMALWSSLYFELCAYGHIDVMNATRDFWIIPHENRTHPRSTRSNEAALHRRYKFADDTTTKKPSDLGILPCKKSVFSVGPYFNRSSVLAKPFFPGSATAKGAFNSFIRLLSSPRGNCTTIKATFQRINFA